MSNLAGHTLGKYRIIERLGRGGMAEVYRAYQPNLEREVAIKVLHGYLADDPEFIGRFQREAKAVAALHHPHIVQIFDYDVENDIYYMVMEYLSGCTLKAHLGTYSTQKRLMPLGDVTKIFTPLCDALDFAHMRGRIHRDIKPANIMFDGERLILTDFGIATIIGGTRFTATGAMVGTPAYMAPEQGRGDPGTTYSDIYSLGVILYEIVTGNLPYDADTPLAIVFKHINDPLPMPCQVNPDLSPSIEKVVIKAMAKVPEDRYQTACALSDALESAVMDEKELIGVLENPLQKIDSMKVDNTLQSTGDHRISSRTDASIKKVTPWKSIGLLGVFLIGALLLIYSSIYIFPKMINELVQNLNQALITSTINPVLATTSSPQTSSQVITAIPIIETSSDALAHYKLGISAYEQGNDDQALNEFSLAINLDPKFDRAYFLRGEINLYNNNFSQSLTDLSKSIELNKTSVNAYIDRARCYEWGFNNTEQALSDLSTALTLQTDNKKTYAILGEIAYLKEDYNQAAFFLSRADKSGKGVTWYWYIQGVSNNLLGRYDEAIASFEETFNISPDYVEAMYGKGVAYYFKQDWDTALNTLDSTITNASDFYEVYYVRGLVNSRLDHLEDAISDYTVVIMNGVDYHWPYFTGNNVYLDRAQAFYKSAQYDNALKDLNSCLETDPTSAEAYFYRGKVYIALGKTKFAIEALNKALDLSKDETLTTLIKAELAAIQK